MNYYELSDTPDELYILTDTAEYISQRGERFVFDDIQLSLDNIGSGLRVRLTADNSLVKFIKLSWDVSIPDEALLSGDAFERTYGDMQWQHIKPARFMPWYFLVSNKNKTACYGVKVRPAALAFWSVDKSRITLWLDVRCGGVGVHLDGRELDVATIVYSCFDGISAFQAAHEFCRKMCDTPLLPQKPVYGSNNWYYAYGHSSAENILKDSRYLSGLTEGLDNRPFMVIDDGWQIKYRDEYNGGPWTAGNKKFPDMKGLASDMNKIGVRPGIWFRPLLNNDDSIPGSWRSNRDKQYLDPSIPDVLEYVGKDISRMCEWGFELIKHDFSTYDIFGLWGFEMNPFPAVGDWKFYDRKKTSAEIIIGLYETILESAGSAIILGCNTIGHLGAGLMHVARIGDDTSGKSWERTRKMGINTLAFRLSQHKTFFAVDADCVGITEHIPWKLNRQWAELLAYSGTPFFASITPDILNKSEKETMRQYFKLASSQNTNAEPLDWIINLTPNHWSLDGKEVVFDWMDPNETIQTNPAIL